MDVESDHEEKTPPVWQKQCQPSPKEETSSKESEESSSEEEQPTNEALCDKAWQQAWHLDTNFDAWWHKKIAKGLPGWVTRDTMICDLPKHWKAQPNHPDLVGPPLEYMRDHQVFEGVRLDIYDLCRFYILGTMGDPPKFPAPQEPTTCWQIQDLLKSARAIGRPYLIFAHSVDSVMAVLLLRELHTATCLQWLPVDLWDKSVKLSFCPFCTYVGGEQPLLLESHNNRALQCELQLWMMPETGIHLFFGPANPQKGVPQVSLQEGCWGSRWQTQEWWRQQRPQGSSKATPNKDSKGATTNSQGSSAPSASQTSPCHSRWRTSHHHKSKKDDGERQKRQLM